MTDSKPGPEETGASSPDESAKDEATPAPSKTPPKATLADKPAGDAADAADAADKPADEPADDSGKFVPDDPEALKAEVERLRAENEALAAEKAPHHFWRNAAAAVLIVLGVILVTMAVSAVWLNRTIMNEDRWVATVAPLAQNADIQAYAATQASDAIFNNVDIQGYVKQALTPLPPAAQFLVTPITAAIQSFIRDAATKITQSQRFYDIWVQMNHVAHKAFISAISNRQGAVIQKQGGTVTLDVSALVDQIKAALVAKGLTFVNNINIPIANQQITLIDSPALNQLGQLIQLMNTMAYVLPILALLLLAGGVAVAVNRQKAVLWMGVGIVAATILPIQAIYLGQVPFANAAMRLGQMPAPAAQAAYSIVFRYLIEANRLVAVVGLVFFIGALFAGPSKWATSLRGGFQHGINNIGPDWDFGPVGEWIFLHRSGVRTAGVIVAIVVMLFVPGKTIWTIVWLVVAVLIWLLLVALFGRPRPALKAADDTTDAAPMSS